MDCREILLRGVTEAFAPRRLKLDPILVAADGDTEKI
jgi:hypothetical protein